MFRRISAISFTYAGVLALNTLDIQSIGSGIGLYSGLLKISFLSNFIAVFILLISSIIILIWPNFIEPAGKNLTFYNHIENESKSNEYCLIVLFNILGALFLISSLDLISMYLSIELQSFGLYILATLYKEKYSSTSAGLKYFLLGGLSSCIILLGCGIIYSYIGLTNLESIYAMISVYFFNYPSFSYSNFNALTLEQSLQANLDVFRGVSLGIILIFSGFLFKIAASPFHNWAPDVYDDSPTLVTVWLTIMPKISILILLLELMIYSAGSSQIGATYAAASATGAITSIITSSSAATALALDDFSQGAEVGLGLKVNFDLLDILTNLLILSSLLSLIIGSIVGLSQIRIKRLLAYSTISHIGFLLLALSVFSKSSIEAFIFYIIQYTITNLDIFLIILAFGYIFKIKYISASAPSAPQQISSQAQGAPLSHDEAPSTLRSVGGGRENESVKLNLSDIEYINNLKGIFYKNPLLSISFSICLFSFAGVPPLIGFFAKQQILYSSNSAGFYFLSIIAILVSVISASYYLKIIKVIHSYPNNLTSTEQVVKKESYEYFTSIHAFIIGFLTLAIILFIFNPELILNCIAIITNLIFNI
jgi:NADH-ubiquinone oxidoreductase chain 2